MVKKSILNDKPEVLISRFKTLLKKEKIPVEKIILFGSYAKGTQKPWSDLDLCVVSSAFGKNGYDETVLLARLASTIEPMIEPHPYHPKDLLDPLDSLAWEIKKTGMIV
ncbi:MAG: nucleotidyltransferase domain-containing protein [bacterium]|nr:nucleotidyltransferase domain-containing protein [bacterium]